MNSLAEVKDYRRRYGKNKLIIDTNLLMPMLVGALDVSLLADFKMTSKYSKHDLDVLREIFRYFQPEIVLTPQVIAEMSNLSTRDIKQSAAVSLFFSRLVERLRLYKEEYIPLSKILDIDLKILTKFGFTDMSISEVARVTGGVILTDDLGLYLHATNEKLPAINFGALRNFDLIPALV